MRPIQVELEGVSRFTKARPDRTHQATAKRADDAELQHLEVSSSALTLTVDGSISSSSIDDFSFRLLAATIVRDLPGPIPKLDVPDRSVSGGSGAAVPRGGVIDRLRPPNQFMIDVKPRSKPKFNPRPTDVHIIPD